MRLVILAQEEPVYFGPFFREVIVRRRADIVLVVLCGSRGAGNHARSLGESLQHLRTLWLMFEPWGFLRGIALRAWQAVLTRTGLLGTRLDQRSIAGAAKAAGIEVAYVNDPNSPACFAQLRQVQPDVIINQTELLLREELLAIPRVGVVNRHASLLPRFRGRLASFWGHAQEPPEYGVTIHFVDSGIDSGPIIVQQRFELDPRLSYAEVLTAVFQRSVGLMDEALSKLEAPGFTPSPNRHAGAPTYRFPSVQEVTAYRERLRQRRAQ
jgi:methionyl-tRNA formyltransferase